MITVQGHGADYDGVAEAKAARLDLERDLFCDFTDYIRYPKIDPNTLRDTVVARVWSTQSFSWRRSSTTLPRDRRLIRLC